MELTPQQKLFCKYYTTKGETFSKGVLSYAMAYDYELPKDEKEKIITDSKEYNICASNASRLLINDNIRKEVQSLLLEQFNENTIDARTTEILLNGKDTDSIQAIKIANDLKQRITKRLDITSAGRPLAGLSDDELKALAE